MSAKKAMRAEAKKRKFEALMRVAEMEEAQSKRKKLCNIGELVDLKEEARKKDDENDVDPAENGGGAAGHKPALKQQRLSPEELFELRARLRLRQKMAMQSPKLFLTLDKMAAEIDSRVPRLFPPANSSSPAATQPQLFLADLQHLLLYVVQGNLASYKPRWCSLIRAAKISRVALVVVQGISSADYKIHSFDCMPFITDKFKMSVQMVNPYQFGRTVADELFQVPLSIRQLKKAGSDSVTSWKDLVDSATNGKDSVDFKTSGKDSVDSVTNGKDSVDSVTNENDSINFVSNGKDSMEETTVPADGTQRSEEVISRLDLLLTTEQMILEDYPMPVSQSEKTKDYVFSQAEYKKVSNSSQMFGLDCEMCQTSIGRNELARVAVTKEDGQCIFDALVKPRNVVTDYLTRYSGITKKMLKNVTTRIEDVQRKIREILPPDAILVGQSLNFDLHALKIFHPYVIDTSLIYNITGIRARRTKLKTLTSMFLNREIQTGGKSGHNPCEDSLAALQLVQLKLRKGLEFGDVIIGGPLKIKVPETPPSKEDASSVVTAGPIETLEPEKNDSHGYSLSANGRTRCESNDEVQSLEELGMNFARQKKAFYQCAAAKMRYDNFFELVRKENKSSAVGGFGDGFHSYLCATRLDGESDERLAEQCQEALSKNFIVCAQFANMWNRDSPNDMQRILRETDRNIETVMTSLSPGALAIVLLSGDHELNHDAMCFVAIT